MESNRSDSDEELDSSWTTGDDPSLSHRRHIDSGAFGDVHEVTLFASFVSHQQIENLKTGQVLSR